MIEWVTKAHALLVQIGISKVAVKDAVASSLLSGNIQLRTGVVDFVEKMSSLQIPVLIFSAGVADVIEEVLRVETGRELPSSFHVVSNRMMFNEDDSLVGFQSPLLHVFNKKATSIQNTSFFSSNNLSERKNVILIGNRCFPQEKS